MSNLDARMLDEHYAKMGWSDHGIHKDPEYEKQQTKIMEEERARDAAQSASRHNSMKIENASVPEEGTKVEATQTTQATQTTEKKQDVFQKIRKGLHL